MIRNAILALILLVGGSGRSFAGYRIVTDTVPPPACFEESPQIPAQEVPCELFIPNAFSPDGDGINDFFKIWCINKYPLAKLEVFNRWGTLVYSKEEYGNEQKWGETEAWWDGSANQGLKTGGGKLPSGTYFYIFYPGESSGQKKGTVFLNR